VPQKVYRADHLELEFLSQSNHPLATAAANTLSDHRVGKGFGKAEIAGFALSAVYRVPPSLTRLSHILNIAA
jgi:hypothetical protein